MFDAFLNVKCSFGPCLRNIKCAAVGKVGGRWGPESVPCCLLPVVPVGRGRIIRSLCRWYVVDIDDVDYHVGDGSSFCLSHPILYWKRKEKKREQ